MKEPVRVGDILASKYRVERVLGKGGMGMVVAARHMQLGSLVALKFMIETELDADEAAGRFIREARAAARLRGENVARVSDFGVLETGAPYIVMEFLEGENLQMVMKARGPLPIAEALDYLLDACRAMAEAHAFGIVHRDLKPQNLMLTYRFDGTPLIKVLDFGISKFIDSMDSLTGSSTETGDVLGSPNFMAPEQIRNAKDVDARADIYALGCIGFRMIAGRLPFQVGSVGEMVGAVLHKEAPPLRTFRPDAPALLEAILARCLQKERDARFDTIHELMAALQSIADGMDAGLTTNGDASLPSRDEVVRSPRSNFAALLGSIAVVGVLAVFAASRYVGPERSTDHRGVAAPTGPSDDIPRPTPPASSGNASTGRPDAAVIENIILRANEAAPPAIHRTAPSPSPPIHRPSDINLLK